MLKYVVILLDKSSVAFCHADNPFSTRELMPLQTLKDAIFWAMKENLNIQFVYPDYELPQDYRELIDTIDHVDIRSDNKGDVVVLEDFDFPVISNDKSVVVRCNFKDLILNQLKLSELIKTEAHVSVIIKDIDKMTDEDFANYKNYLQGLSKDIEKSFIDGHNPQVNLLTDRLVLDAMNNCNAGWESITIAPNGKFYVCPAFYFEDENNSVGDLENGLEIKNPQLYQLSHAPICWQCDAWQCRRCVWLNRKTTLEVNTPSHEQCVVAHLERNASRDLLQSIRKHGSFLPDKEIDEIDYLDPFDKIVN